MTDLKPFERDENANRETNKQNNNKHKKYRRRTWDSCFHVLVKSCRGRMLFPCEFP